MKKTVYRFDVLGMSTEYSLFDNGLPIKKKTRRVVWKVMSTTKQCALHINVRSKETSAPEGPTVL